MNLSEPTLNAHDPSLVIFIELIPPLCPFNDATFLPVSLSQTFTSVSIIPPESKIKSLAGLKHNVLTIA